MTVNEGTTSSGGGIEPTSSGASSHAGSEGDENTTPSGDTVSYETHRKLLGEKKRASEELSAAKAKLAEKEREENERKESELKKNNEWKKLAESKDKELGELRNKEKLNADREVEAKKLSSFLKTLNVDLEDKYWGLVNLNEISINPDTGEIDDMSVTDQVEKFRNSHPKLLANGKSTGVPNSAPQGTGRLSREEWLKLPPKEMKSKMKDARGW